MDFNHDFVRNACSDCGYNSLLRMEIDEGPWFYYVLFLLLFLGTGHFAVAIRGLVLFGGMSLVDTQIWVSNHLQRRKLKRRVRFG